MAEPQVTDAAMIQRMLDVLGATPGGILIRGPDRWIVLPPGPTGWVLAINAGGFPEWTDPATIDFG